MSTFLVTGSNRIGALTFWSSTGTIQQICYYPAITDASFNTDWPGSAYRISCGSVIAVAYIDSARVQFVNKTTLAFISMYQYDTSLGNRPYRCFAVGSEIWVFWSDGNNFVWLDKFSSSGALLSTTAVDITNTLHYLEDVATWDNNTFYILTGQAAPKIYSWTVGDASATFIRNITSDMDLFAGDGSTQTICMHGPTTLVASARNTGADPNIGLFDMSSGGAFIKRYLYSTFPRYPSPANETTFGGPPFAVCSDGDHTLYTGANGGLTIWKIDTSTDTITIFNSDLQTFNWGTGRPTNPRFPTVPYVHPVSPTNTSIGSSENRDGIVGFNFIDFNGKTFPFAHYDGLLDSTDYRFWPITTPPPPPPTFAITSKTITPVFGVVNVDQFNVSVTVTFDNTIDHGVLVVHWGRVGSVYGENAFVNTDINNLVVESSPKTVNVSHIFDAVGYYDVWVEVVSTDFLTHYVSADIGTIVVGDRPQSPPPFISSSMQEPPIKSGIYRYLFHDLLTNNPLAELELKNVSYDFSLNGPGGFSGSLNIASQQAMMENVIGSTTPGRTAVYIDRNGTITWGGILWKRRYSASNRTVTLEGKTFESYFARRRIVDSLSYPNTDQLAVMRSLINNMQAKPGGNIGIEVGNELSGRAIDAFFFWFELKPYLEVLQEFAGVQHGFDFRVRCFRDSETKLIRKVLEFGYPHLGRTALQTNLLFEYPNSNIVTYNWDEDAESGADVFHATGANEGEALMVSTATSPMLLNQGWPLLEDSNAYADVTLWADLDARSQSDLQSRLVPISTPSLTVFGDADPILGSYQVGDFARFRIRDDRFPLGVDLTQRLYGLKVTVDAAGTREKIDLTVGVQH